MIEKIKEIHRRALNDIAGIHSSEDLQTIRNVYLSKKSELMSYMGKMKELTGEEKASFGQMINSIKNDIAAHLEEKRKVIEAQKLDEQLKKEVIDYTLPPKNYRKGSKHPFTR